MIRKCLYRAIPYRVGKVHPPTPYSESLFLADFLAHRAVASTCTGTCGFIDKVEAILGKRIENRSRGRPTQATEQQTEAGVGK